MRVSIVGAGYVGLVSGACLAEQGHSVTCVDTDPHRIGQILEGKAPFYEPDLDPILADVAGKGLQATTHFREAVGESDLTLIAVGTPSRSDGDVDLTAIDTVAKQLGEVIRDSRHRHTVVVKSTVPPGTTEGVVGRTIESVSGRNRRVDFGLGMNPEFLTEGTAVADFRDPDRIVLGGADEQTFAAQRELYKSFTDTPILEVGNSTAEMIKYMSNALLATMISFANEFADLSERIDGVDAQEVQRGVHLSRYLTAMPKDSARTAQIASFVEAGCGFGGSCLPKDVSGMTFLGRQNGSPMRILEAVLSVNAGRSDRMIGLLQRRLTRLSNKRVAVLGLAFRPDTNDMRESPAIGLIERLTEEGCHVVAFDPVAMSEARRVIDSTRLEYAQSLRECVDGVDAVMIVTRWPEFEDLPRLLVDLGQRPTVVDGRRILKPGSVENYEGIGLSRFSDNQA